MRKILIVLVLVIVTMSIFWAFAGRQISSFVDGYKTIETASSPIEGITLHGISVEGREAVGVLLVDDPSAPVDSTARAVLRLELMMPSAQSPHVGTTKNGEAALSFAGRVFTFSPLLSGETDEMIESMSIGRPPTDKASISLRQSVLGWLEPLNLNFMTGKSPSWKRHHYYQLIWKKPNGAKLEMLWSVNENKNALIRIDISNPAR
jgi:hypothetical protein